MLSSIANGILVISVDSAEGYDGNEDWAASSTGLSSIPGSSPFDKRGYRSILSTKSLS